MKAEREETGSKYPSDWEIGAIFSESTAQEREKMALLKLVTYFENFTQHIAGQMMEDSAYGKHNSTEE